MRAELLRPGFNGADAIRTGARRTGADAAGLADTLTAAFTALPSFAADCAAGLETRFTAASRAAGLAGASADFLAAGLLAFFTGSAIFLAATAGSGLATARAGSFFSVAFNIVSPLETA